MQIKQQSITVSSPATVANIVCGFDILGFAINQPEDFYTLTISDTKGVTIINEDNFNLPLKAEENVAGAALLAFLEAVPEINGFT
ncbi:MAG: homoserine kinase, partial [Hydrotalea flava]|nr:homoserine kinase [Hydrotalea flava]